MKFSRTFRVAFLVTVYLSALVIATHVNDEEKITFKKLDTQFDIINKLFEQSKANVQNVKDNKQVIKDHIKDFGEKIMKSINFEIKNTAISGYLRTNFTKSSNDVVKCIQNNEKKASEDVAKYYSEKFVKPIGYYASEVEADQENDMKIYEEDRKMSEITDDSSNISDDDVKYLRNLIQLVINLTRYTNKRAEENWVAMKKCFPEPYP